jgi:hypothetical protein
MTANRSWLALVAVVVGGLACYPVLFGGATTVPDELLQEIVYVDKESGDVFLLRARSSPEMHPETGDPTLIPGMYCEKCKVWKPVGPMELLQTLKVPRDCPIHKTPLSLEGPLPETP